MPRYHERSGPFVAYWRRGAGVYGGLHRRRCQSVVMRWAERLHAADPLGFFLRIRFCVKKDVFRFSDFYFRNATIKISCDIWSSLSRTREANLLCFRFVCQSCFAEWPTKIGANHRFWRCFFCKTEINQQASTENFSEKCWINFFSSYNNLFINTFRCY